jgi:polar amino acid transport system substrate-binding protein
MWFGLRRTRALIFFAGFLLASGPLAAEVIIPNYWDPRRRIERPNLSGLAGPIRFLTGHDHPPFNFLDAQGELTGFHVELVRAACLELNVACTIQARAFDLLVPALREGRGDVLIAGAALTPALRREFEVGDAYLRSPARFVVRRESTLETVDPEALEGRRIAVEDGTAHAAYLDTFFSGARVQRFPSAAAARAALQRGEADAVFGDAVALAFWLNGTASAGCCVFRGGPFTESRFFGEGYAMVFRPNTDILRRAFDHALQRLSERGVYEELYLRWFPIGLY